MNIVHISSMAPYNDGWGFQENLLPKYHAKLGHKVTLVVPNKIHEGGKVAFCETGRFTSVGGFEVIRLPYKEYPLAQLTHIFWKLDVTELLWELDADVIFCHGLVSRTVLDIIKYMRMRKKQGRKCTLIQDNHLDYNIGTDPKTVKEKLLRGYYRLMNRRTQRYALKVYGVTPWRKQYAEEYYKISPEKTDVLIMGADDEMIDFSERDNIRREIRGRYAVADGDFLVVTGGKIDEKKKIHVLMEALGGKEKIKLLVFGNVSDDMKDAYDELLRRFDNIISIGWIESGKVYDYFFAADLVCFPGQHSVLWEQACASKVPCLFARWPGMDHVDNGGNSDFADEISAESLARKIDELCFTEKYKKMKSVAASAATDVYLYSKIAERSLEGI